MVERTVTVTGQGSTSVVPDVAVLQVAAVTRAATAAEAFGGTASAVEALLAAARSAVPDVGVRSQGIDLWTESDDRGRTTAYRCQHGVTVRCPSLEVASTLLSTLVDQVGDRLQVNGVGLEVADSSAAYAEARSAAYADAVERATALADLAGAGLGGALTVVEGGSGGWSPVAKVAAAADMPIAAGERSVDAAVTVTFALT